MPDEIAAPLVLTIEIILIVREVRIIPLPSGKPAVKSRVHTANEP